MKFLYDEDTDSLYIDLSSLPGIDSREVASGVVVDLDAEGRVVGIDIQNASQVVDLSCLKSDSLPVIGGARGS